MSQIVGYIHSHAGMPDSVARLGKQSLNHVFVDRSNGKRARRPQLVAAIQHLGRGDRLVVPSMSCLARSACQLHDLVRRFHAKGVAIEFVEHGIVLDTDPSCPVSRSMLALLEAFARSSASRSGTASGKASRSRRSEGCIAAASPR